MPVKKKRNPLRIDPTRTGLLRRAFEAEIFKRFRRLKGKILDVVDRRDSFALRTKRVFNTEVLNRKRFEFLSDARKIDEFEKWLSTQIEADILGGAATAEDAWLKRYIAEGYEKGAGRAFDDVRKPALASQNGSVSDFFQGTRDEFLRQSFAAPEALEKVKILVSRTFSDLRNVTDVMKTQIRRELADGLVRGENPRVIARSLNNRVDKIGRTRSNIIARTEIIRAHSEGQLDSFEKLGVERVGVMAEWSTAGDDRVCPQCQPLEGTVMTIKEARGIIPRHPQCRCTWIPANVGEDKRNQNRSKSEIEGAVSDSIRAQFPNERSLSTARGLTRWRGADSRFSKNRPRSVLDRPLRARARGAAGVSSAESKAAREAISAISRGSRLDTALKKLDEMPCIAFRKKNIINALLIRVLNADPCLDVDMTSVLPFKKRKLPKVDWNADDVETVEVLISDLNTQTTSLNKDKVKKFLSTIDQGKDILPPRVLFFEDTGEYFIARSHHKVVANKLYGNTKMKVRLKKIPVQGAGPAPKPVKTKFQKALDEALAKEVAKEAAEKAAKEAAEAAVTIPKTPAGELPQPSNLKKIRNLPGSTRPELMEDTTTGKQWVMKSIDAGIDPKHLRSEALADDLYRELGVDVPLSGIVETAEGPVKLAEFIDGGKILNDLTPAAKRKAYAELRKNFVADALLANHDVVGLSLDNVLVVGGKPLRIDNGGALLFRAQGGAKRNFGKVVEELTTMRSATVNPQTAKVFSSITEDMIDEQIEAILKKRASFLAKVDDEDLRKILSDRLDYLEERIKVKTVVAPKIDKSGGRFAEQGITKETPARVKKSRVNGTSVAVDKDLVEDGTALFWEEVDEAGDVVTRMQMKVTPKGGDKINAAIGQVAETVNVPTTGALPEDTFWDSIVKAAKTVNHHAADGQYNAATLQALDDTMEKLLGLLNSPDTSLEVRKMARIYRGYINDIRKAKDLGKTTDKFTQYVRKPKDVPKPDLTQGIASRKEQMRFNTSKIVNGRATREQGFNSFGGQHIVIDLEDGVQATYFPPTASRFSDEGLALRGNFELKITGEVTEDTLRKAMQSLENLGIDTTAPTAEFQELLYLHRSVVLNNDHKLKGYVKIWEDADLSDGEKVKKIKAWAKKRYPDAVFEGPQYNPLGFSETGFGDGYQHWTRWDLTAEKIEEEMKDYVLTHRPGAGIEDVIDKVLESGGQMTSTVQRIRKGVDVGGTGGMSSSADVRSGGASYFFTRIRRASKVKTDTGFTFKIRNLARQDAVSYDGDKYGAIDQFNRRRSKIDEYKENALRSSNETIFKHGLSLLDDLEHINVGTRLRKDRIVDIFKRHKIDKLNDGRKIEDVVLVEGNP